MAVLINLLPDQRIAKEKARRQKQLVLSISALIIGGSVGIVILLALINGALNLAISAKTNDINKHQNDMLSKNKDLKLAVTTQEHLVALDSLYAQRVLASRLFEVLGAASPKDYALNTLTTDPQGNMKLGGLAKSYAVIQVFAKALEASKNSATQGGQSNFPQVQLLSAAAQTDGKVAFSITATVDPGVTSGKQ